MLLAHAAKGKVIQSQGDTVVFQPHGTTYQLHLKPAGGTYGGPVDEPVEVIIRGAARKAYSVPSGGLFVSPIMGPPRVLQGRVKDINESELSLNCGVLFNVTLPTKVEAGVELATGDIGVGSLVNVVLLPGATIELA